MKRSLFLITAVCLLIFLATAEPALAGEVYAETPLGGASEAQLTNIRLAVQAMDGMQLEFGGEFSFNETVGPRTQERGFEAAINGRGVKVVGGGVAQTATTLYLALMQRDDIEYTSIYTYDEQYTGSYVESGYDAILTDYANGQDFAFGSWYEGTLTVYMWMSEESLCCYIVEDGDAHGMSGAATAQAMTPVQASDAQENNIRLVAQSINGCTLEQGDVFSFNDIVGPRSAQFGYEAAVNGRGVKVVGGGVAQAAATVYLAVRELDCVELLETEFYGSRFTGSYVDSGEDAVLVDYNGNIDFSFAYLGEGSLTVCTFVKDGWLVCEVFEE